ncbi:O-antigen polymerase [Pontibacillus marinus]|uniref:O-antigen polymerase n=1 Tax=Pontibacillus marinus TaxID=273164 RepID=UPI001376522A|nr:O-antigen polymerase [Pontibacillus marinus]
MLLSLTIISAFRSNTFKNPITLINLWWGGWLLLSSFGFYHLFIPSTNTYLYILGNISFLTLGYLLVLGRGTVNSKQSYSKAFELKNLKLFNLVQLITLFIMLFFAIKGIKIMVTQNITPQEYRGYVFKGYLTDPLYGSNFIFLFIHYIVKGFILVNSMVCTFLYLLRKKYYRTFLISIANLLLLSAFMVSRIDIFRYIILILIFFFLARKLNLKLEVNINIISKKVLTYFSFMIIILFIVSYLRAGQVFKSILVYFTGPFIALDTFLEQYNIQPQIPLQFGRATLGGIDDIIVLIIRRFNDTIVSTNYKLSFLSDAISIGESQTYNAFYTMFVNFFIDGNVFGSLLISFFLGITISLLFVKTYTNPNIFVLTLFIYILHMVIFGSLRWEFSSGWSWIVLFLLVIYKKLFFKSSKNLNNFKGGKNLFNSC